MYVKVHIIGSMERLFINCQPADTLHDMKEKVQGQKGTMIHLQRMYCFGTLMDDCMTLESYNIEADEADGLAEQELQVEFLIDGPLSREEAQFIEDLWEMTNGPGWTRTVGWDERHSKPNGCLGIKVEDKHITHVCITNNNLRGTIPESVRNLTRLVEFNLSYNLLTGGIPEGIACCEGLEMLYIQWNRLNLALPRALGQLPHLKHLYLDHNLIAGEIPENIGESVNVRRINLANNQISGKVPFSIRLLLKLEIFHIMHNKNLYLPRDISPLASAQEFVEYYKWARVKQVVFNQ